MQNWGHKSRPFDRFIQSSNISLFRLNDAFLFKQAEEGSENRILVVQVFEQVNTSESVTIDKLLLQVKL